MTESVNTPPPTEAIAPPQPPKDVLVGSGPMVFAGKSYAEKGQAFPIDSIFPNDKSAAQGDMFTKVYFKTGSGNVYKIDNAGRLVDSRSSKDGQKTVAFDLTRERLNNRQLEVGKPFSIIGNFNTSPIIEIVTVADRALGVEPDTQIPHSNIVETFDNNLSYELEGLETDETVNPSTWRSKLNNVLKRFSS